VSCKIEYDCIQAAAEAAAVPSRNLYGLAVTISMCAPAAVAGSTVPVAMGPSTAPPGYSLGARPPAAVPPAGPEPIDERKLFVKGLSYGTTSAMLKEAFEDLGELESAECVMDRQLDRCKGYGFVVYKTVAGAQRALAGAPATLDGKAIKAFLSQVREQAPGPQYGGQPLPAAYGQSLYPHQYPPQYSTSANIGGGSQQYPVHQMAQPYPPQHPGATVANVGAYPPHPGTQAYPSRPGAQHYPQATSANIGGAQPYPSQYSSGKSPTGSNKRKF
jgi:RNA recognition motif-containing protein